MLKTKAKRLLALLLCAVMCFGSFGAVIPVFAATQAKMWVLDLPRSGDPSARADWGNPAYVSLLNGWDHPVSDKATAYSMQSYDGQVCYCIEPGVHVWTGSDLTGKGEDYWESHPDLNPTLPARAIRTWIGRALQYGYTGNISTQWRSDDPTSANQMATMFATQYLIWEVIVGERDNSFNKIDAHASGKSNALEMLNPNHPLRAQILEQYSRLERELQNHTKIPSFMEQSPSAAQTQEMQWDGSKYTVSLPDSNSVVDRFDFSSSTPGVACSVNGNTLTISSATAPSGPVQITASKRESNRRAVVTWTDGIYGPGHGDQLQDLVTYGDSISDPVPAYLNIVVPTGAMHLVKTSEDGKVSGIPFTVAGNGISREITTAADGSFDLTGLPAGVYEVTEHTADKYTPQAVQRVTLIGGRTTTVNFDNVLRRGSLDVTKTSEDSLTAGRKFHLYGTSLSGLPVDAYAVTDSDGAAHFRDVLIGTGYTLEEVDTPDRYVVPSGQTAAVEWNKVTQKSFHNTLKKWKVTAAKSDRETGTAQGDASLAGAVYGVYKGQQLVDSFVTDSLGRFTTGYYICDSDWSLREISPSEGYQLDSTIYHVGAEPGNFEVEYNAIANDVREAVIKGAIALTKHTDDGDTQIETPETGAVFEVYLKSAGSYGAAKDTERDRLVCDEHGYAQSKQLPYGVYTVEQTEGWEGKEKLPPFDVTIEENGKTSYYIINNAVFESLVQIVKKDMETGKIIPVSGVGFQVRDMATGQWITQHLNYPTPVDIDTFYTDSTGKLMLPSPLPFGNYELVERQTAHGYVLDATPVPFEIDGSQTVVTVEKSNIAQKGIIHVGKEGEVFSSVTEQNGVYRPVYQVQGLPGGVYQVRAAEDIVTADGTLRAQAGELVDTLTTGSDGTDQSKPLYLGQYEVTEIQAPAGMVLNPTPQLVTLRYAGQDVEITSTSATFYNERQRVEIDLLKMMEQDELFHLGMNGELQAVVFGLYASAELQAADGSVIPQDGLIELLSLDEDGKAAFTTDLPQGSFYVQEAATDGHYQLSDQKYPVEFRYAGQDVETVHLHVNDGEAIANSLIRGTVIGQKVDADGFEICGSVFGLFRLDETAFTAGTAILTCETNEIGVFGFLDVPYGNYLIREISCPPAFILNEEVYPVTIEEQKQQIEIEVENQFVTGSVRAMKVDVEFTDQLLPGAGFEVYVDVNGNREYDDGIDKLVGELEEAEAGIYQQDGLRYGGYFLRESAAPGPAYLADEGYYYFEITEDAQIVTVGNVEGSDLFADQPVRGALELCKQDAATGQLLPGVGIRIKDAAGSVIHEGYTGEDGVVRFEGLRYGRYTWQEFDALDGYVLDAQEHPFTITEHGQVVKATLTNEPNPVPDTGDAMYNILPIVNFALVAAVAAVVFSRRKK